MSKTPRPAQVVALESSPVATTTLASRLLANLAIHEWVMLAYLAVLLGGVLAGEGPRRQTAISWLLLDTAVVGAILLLFRGGLLAMPRAGGLALKLSPMIAIVGSFFQLQYILPTARRRIVDADLYALDLKLFGFEPAEAWDKFVTPATTDWFAFFYYLYFFLLGGHVIPMIFFSKQRRVLTEFATGLVIVFCVGQALYNVVPGFGPYAFLADKFTHQLNGTTFWPLVRDAVASVEGSARTDIFPSLHTGGPTFIALFSFRNRALSPFKYTWLPLAFIVSQIILATMFLRWHYLIDVCVGLVLAVTAWVLSEKVARFEDERREREGLQPVWL